jgi:branched-chain amino acid aminotransferase
MSDAPPDAVVWLDGALVALSDARISPFDHGLTVGDGVFETLRVYDGVPFAWTRHYERLARSAGGLGLSVPDARMLQHAAGAVLEANGLREARLRVTVTGGPAPAGSERGPGGPTVLVVATAMVPWPATVDVVTVPWTRNERSAVAGLKTTSYAENVRALAHAHAQGAGEAIFPNTRDELCEATGSNVFVVRDGVLRTPEAASGCLLGVTRALVLELAAAAGEPTYEGSMAVSELAQADEVFLTSSTREIHPVARVDGRRLSPVPGPVTAGCARRFGELLARDLDP